MKPAHRSALDQSEAGPRYSFRGKLWRYSRAADTWHFITLPKRQSATIKAASLRPRRGWGSIRVTVTIGATRWKTSIFPEAGVNTYLLPVKAEVRRRENISAGDTVSVVIQTDP
jgi:hypothetical protein